MTATSDALRRNFQSPNTAKDRIYVHPGSGSDTSNGLTWGSAVKSIAKAVQVAPNGATIILSNKARHDVGSGVSWSHSKILKIVSEGGTFNRQFDDYTTGSGVIYSSSPTRPSYFLKTVGDGRNAYGGDFSGLTFDTSTLAVGGACIHITSQNHVNFRDLLAAQIGWEGFKTLIRAECEDIPGTDCSWGTVDNCRTTNCAGLVTGTTGEFNYWRFPGSKFQVDHGTTDPAAIGMQMLSGRSEPNFSMLHLEGWPLGVYAKGFRGVIASALTGEWTDVMVKLEDCPDSTIVIDSSGGGGWSRVEVNGGTTGRIIGTSHVQGDATASVQLITPRYNSLKGGQIPGTYRTVIYDQDVSHPIPVGPEMPQVGSQDLGLMCGWKADYTTDGSSWQEWYAWTDPAMDKLLIDSPDEVVLDSGHNRVRFRTHESFNGSVNGLLRLRCSGYVLSHPGNKITVRTLDSGGGVIASVEQPFGDGDVSPQTAFCRGVEIAVPSGGGDRLEVELIMPGITAAGQELYIRRLTLIGSACEVSGQMHGRHMSGRITPAGNVAGGVGDAFHCVGSAVEADAGLWVKTSGYGDANGWTKLS